jgi:hypothetical protein
MKRMIVATVVVFNVMLLIVPRLTSQAGPSLEKKIEAASAEFLDGKNSDSKTKGFLLLLEAIEDASVRAELSPEFREKINAARRFCGQFSIVDQNGVKALREAYAMLNGGREFQIPAQVTGIETAVQYCREEFAAALEALKAGNPTDAAKSLLEAAVMVVTPMEAHGVSMGQFGDESV